jgi:hypothetical protein
MYLEWQKMSVQTSAFEKMKSSETSEILSIFETADDGTHIFQLAVVGLMSGDPTSEGWSSWNLPEKHGGQKTPKTPQFDDDF